MVGRVRLQGECFFRDGGKHLDSSARWPLKMCNSGEVQFELRICRFRCVIEMMGITCGHEKGSQPVQQIPFEAITAVGSDVLATGLGLGFV